MDLEAKTDSSLARSSPSASHQLIPGALLSPAPPPRGTTLCWLVALTPFQYRGHEDCSEHALHPLCQEENTTITVLLKHLISTGSSKSEALIKEVPVRPYKAIMSGSLTSSEDTGRKNRPFEGNTEGLKQPWKQSSAFQIWSICDIFFF